MLKNYFKIAWRSLAKNKTFSLINIIGLAIGITSCMLIAVFVYDELNYDNYATRAGQIYRVGLNVTGNSDIVTYPMVDIAVGKGIQSAFPGVLETTRLVNKGESFVRYGNKQFKEQKMAFVDENFLRFFSIPLIEGEERSALSQPNSLVISKSFANKYFGNESPIGKVLELGRETMKVTGVIEKIPDNSHFHFDALMSMATIHPDAQQQTWSNVGFFTYLLLDKNVDPSNLEKQFPTLVEKYVVPEVQHDMGVSLAEARKSINTFVFFLQPLKKIHLYADSKFEIEANGDYHYIYIFGALAIFILLLACVNFTNLSTANSARRSREVGIRKVMGSMKPQLIFQFLAESVLITFSALILACVLVYLLIPFFNQISGKNIHFNFFLDYRSIIVMIILGLITGIVAGVYPAFFLSSFQTIRVLKGALSGGSRKSNLRSGLVVFQFFVSIALIIATIVVYQQLHFMQDKKLGYDKDQVVFIQDTYLLGNEQIPFKQQIQQDSRVVNASLSRNFPGNPYMGGTEIYGRNEGNKENSKEIHTNIYQIDYDYISTLGMNIITGRNFSKDFPTDSTGVIINESAVRDLGWSGQNPIGKIIVRSGQAQYKVVGVVADFHYASVKQKIAPLMLLLGNRGGGVIVKIHTKDITGFLADAKKQWEQLKPDGPFAYYFLDSQFATLYASEQRTGQIFTAFAIIAIAVASLGLFGLAAFTAEQRTKEVGIRKVLGATVQQVLFLLSKEFLVLVSLSFLIAVPVTAWAMHLWLQDFAYRVSMSWWIFAIAGIVALLIALFTISFQAIKAAVANPVKSLRTE